MPFYACEGPNGEKGVWTKLSTNEVMGDNFDPLALTPDERKDYAYEGPEVIYTFWAKHGPCSVPGCGHRTPLMSSPVVAIKSLSIKAWLGVSCGKCHESFDVEQREARMAPDVPLVVTDSEVPYALMDSEGHYRCPRCQHEYQDFKAAKTNESILLPKKLLNNKKVELTLLIHPDWLRGIPGKDKLGMLGGAVNSDIEGTCRWNIARNERQTFIEVRGALDSTVYLDSRPLETNQGCIPKDAHFICQADTCGKEQKTLHSLQESGDSAFFSLLAIQGYSAKLEKSDNPYRGRFFICPSNKDVRRLNAAIIEWHVRKDDDLKKYWPKSEIPYGLKTHIKDPLPKHGYSKWEHLFNPRQLILHSLILKAIDEAHGFTSEAIDFVLGAFQQYLTYQNMFCFWHKSKDHFAPFLSNNNLNQKNICIEVGVFSPIGYGPWRSAKNPILESIPWMKNPWELVPTELIKAKNKELSGKIKSKSFKVYPGDRLLPHKAISQGSSTELRQYDSDSIDLVVTDPPFSGLFQYAEFADFSYVWLRLLLKEKYPEIFNPEFTPKTLEAVANEARNPDDADDFYKRVLTNCWKEAHRLLKRSGILAFTFHHSEDDPWVDVLESLFQAGFYLEATYPVRSDETKGDKAQFGSQKIEYDIIHVCRKRTEEPTRISWAKLRRRILSDVRQLQNILEHHQNEGLPRADIQVIKRGKALEYFSRHYGQVYVEEGREFTVKEALVGINQILDDQDEGESGSTPVNCEPITRQFLRIFAGTPEVPRDHMQKFLRGTGIGPSDFVERGWCEEKKKIFHWLSPLTFAQANSQKAKSLSRDMDQAMLLIGACYPDSGIQVKKLLDEDFKPHPALGDLLGWLVTKGGSLELRNAAITARQLYNNWAAQHQAVIQKQMSLFDMD
nr:DUF1156 domain-containing protein [Methylicorpusculum oleiharenae]